MEDGDADDAEPMEEDTPRLGHTQNAKSKVSAEFKEQVLQVLQQREFAGLRAAKLTQDDFLLLLSLFNEAGFHFA